MLLPELVEALDGPVGDKGVLDNAAQIEVDEGHGSQVVTGEPRVDDDLVAVAYLPVTCSAATISILPS
jgi:hypothetical protein